MKVGTAGGIEAVVRAINTHIDNADVCKSGCDALRNMTVNGKNTLNKTNSKHQMKNEQLRTN